MGIICLATLMLVLACLSMQWRFMNKQQAVLRRLNERIKQLEKYLAEKPAKKPVLTAISITKDEPISKYKSVTLPDDIQISFVDKEEK